MKTSIKSCFMSAGEEDTKNFWCEKRKEGGLKRLGAVFVVSQTTGYCIADRICGSKDPWHFASLGDDENKVLNMLSNGLKIA